jgi:hypothetical protein
MASITTYQVIEIIENDTQLKESDFIISEVKQAVDLYPEEQEKRPFRYWRLVVQHILYNIINNRKND